LRVAAAGPGVVRIASSANFGARVVPEAALAGQLGQWQAYGKWMVQQGLDLVRVGGRVCDVRVLALKDGRARWRVAGMTVRRARPGSVVSNLHQGGTVLPFQAFACRVPRRRGAAPLGVELRRLVKRILPAVDAIAPRAGDVGVDIGVDRDGRLWIIEVNTKPGRSGRLANPAVYSLPMEYARYLAGFGPASPARGVPPRPGTEGSGKESTALERIPEVWKRSCSLTWTGPWCWVEEPAAAPSCGRSRSVTGPPTSGSPWRRLAAPTRPFSRTCCGGSDGTRPKPGAPSCGTLMSTASWMRCASGRAAWPRASGSS